MKFRSLFSLLLAVAACAFFPGRLQAQSDQNSDFSNVNDILHGNRTLLKMTDIKIFGYTEVWEGNTGSWLYDATGLTSNSSIGPINIVGSNGTGLRAFGIKSFSGWMFSDRPGQVEAVTVPLAVRLYMFHNQPYQPMPTPPTSSTVITGGAMADFNLDGYDDFAFSYDDGTIVVATAVDVSSELTVDGGSRVRIVSLRRRDRCEPDFLDQGRSGPNGARAWRGSELAPSGNPVTQR